jgi:predicted AlkP superfamily phosphohydrolase/phosphomutase
MMGKRRCLHALVIFLGLALLNAGCSRTPQHKVFVLGMDGLTFDLLIPWVQEGRLPHFAQLLKEGSSAQLVSTIPPTSPPAWTSAITGVNPGKHGIYGFIKGLGSDSEGRLAPTFLTSQDRSADPLWVILSEQERRSVVINVPSTSPPDEIDGIMISGFPHVSPTYFTYPPEYRLKIPDYRTDPWGREISGGEEHVLLKDLNDVTDRRAEVVFKLLEEEQWDLFFVVFTITDKVQHYFWKFMDPKHPDWDPEKARLYGDAILKTYQRMDQLLGQLRSYLDDQTTLMVMSDHGFGPVYTLVNSQNFIDQLDLPGEFGVEATENFGGTFILTTQQEPSTDAKTRRAYVQTGELLKKELEELRDPVTGQMVVQKVFHSKDIYWGPHLDRAPLYVALENEGYLFFNWHRTQDKKIFLQKTSPLFSKAFSGYHAMNGVLIMAGANVRQGANNFDAQLVDIAPSVLYLLGEPIPQEMDGKILEAPISQEYVASHALDARWTRTSKPRQAVGLADSTEAINRYIEEQLRAIGYVQ